MDGNYQNRKKFINKVLQNWINKVVNEKLWDSFVDIHIDEIDRTFKEKKLWISGSLYVLRCLYKLVDKSLYEVFLVIPLICDSEPSKVIIKNIDSLDKELDITPPSFYLFPKTNNKIFEIVNRGLYLKEISEKLNYKIFYIEEKEAEEYYRALYIT